MHPSIFILHPSVASVMALVPGCPFLVPTDSGICPKALSIFTQLLLFSPKLTSEIPSTAAVPSL